MFINFPALALFYWGWASVKIVVKFGCNGVFTYIIFGIEVSKKIDEVGNRVTNTCLAIIIIVVINDTFSHHVLFLKLCRKLGIRHHNSNLESLNNWHCSKQVELALHNIKKRYKQHEIPVSVSHSILLSRRWPCMRDCKVVVSGNRVDLTGRWSFRRRMSSFRFLHSDRP